MSTYSIHPKIIKIHQKRPKIIQNWTFGVFSRVRKKYVFLYGFLRPFTGKIRPLYHNPFVRVDFSGTYQVRTRFVLVRTRYVPKKSYHNPCKIDLGGGKTLPKLVGVEVVLIFLGFLDGNHDTNNVDIASNNIFD